MSNEEERRDATTTYRDVVDGFVVVSPTFASTFGPPGLRTGDTLMVDGDAYTVLAVAPCGADIAGADLPSTVQVSLLGTAAEACVVTVRPSWSWLNTLGPWIAWDLAVRSDLDVAREGFLRAGQWSSRAFSYAPPLGWTTLRPLLQGLGLDVVVEEEVARAVALDDSELRTLSWGRIHVAATVDASGVPIHGGIRCERVFGPMRDYECQCGKYRQMRDRGVVCEKCGVEVIGASARAERLARIELSQPYASPLFEGVEQQILPVVPPALRDEPIDQCYLDILTADAEGKRVDHLVATLFVDGPHSLAERCDALWSDDLFQRPAELSGAANIVVAEVDPTHCLLPRALAHELFEQHAKRIRVERGRLQHLRPPDDEALLRDLAALDEWVILAAGTTTLLRRVQLWDEAAIGVDPAAAALLPEVGAAVHVPVVAEAVLELQDAPAARPPSNDWLSEAVDAESLVEAIADAVVAQRAEPVGHPVVAAALGIRPAPLQASRVTAFTEAEAERRRMREARLDGDWTPPPALDLTLAELPFPEPVLAKLDAAGLSKVRTLCEWTPRDLLRSQGFGQEDLAAVTEVLRQHRLSLHPG